MFEKKKYKHTNRKNTYKTLGYTILLEIIISENTYSKKEYVKNI